MSSPTLALGSLRAAHVRLFVPWQGRWIADVDVDLGDARTVPSGAQTLHVGAAELAGTVDPDRVGRFGAKASLRLLGGGAGWQKTVAERHYHNDAGVRTDAVLSTTAAEVGEKIVDTSPVRLGVDFTRARGPASQVLEGLDWRVDLDGTTVVGARKTIAAPATLQVLDWDGDRQRAELASDEIVTPGTQITDDRFGTIVVRDVEQTFSDGAARATAWCGPSPASRLMGALTSLVRHKSRQVFLAVYRYRVIAEGVDGRLTLQAVESTRGLPDVLPISVWPGMAGLSAQLVPGTEVLVEFIAGDPARPIVRSFQSGAPPLVFTLEAVAVNVTTPAFAVTGVISAAGIAAGPCVVSGAAMAVGGALAEGLVKYPELATVWAQLVAACAAHVPPITVPPLPPSAQTTVFKAL